MNPDSVLFHLVNNLAGASPVLDAVVSFLVNDYALPALFAFIVGALWFAGADGVQHKRNQLGVLYTLLGLLIANLVVKVCWVLFFRPRPFAVEEGVKLLFYRPSVSSFPSEPVATLTALAFGVFLFQRRLGSPMLGLTFAFAFGRVMAGVHYPSDVIAGVLIGVLGVYLPYRYLRGLDRLCGYIIQLANRFGLA